MSIPKPLRVAEVPEPPSIGDGHYGLYPRLNDAIFLPIIKLGSKRLRNIRRE